MATLGATDAFLKTDRGRSQTNEQQNLLCLRLLQPLLATLLAASLLAATLLASAATCKENTVRRHFVPRHFVPGHILSRDNMSPGQYVALCPLYFAVQMGDILSQETYCPGSVRRHFVPGDILSRFCKATFCPGRHIVPVL